MFNELKEVKCFKEIKGSQVKAEAYLELEQPSVMKLFVKTINGISH